MKTLMIKYTINRRK